MGGFVTFRPRPAWRLGSGPTGQWGQGLLALARTMCEVRRPRTVESESPGKHQAVYVLGAVFEIEVKFT